LVGGDRFDTHPFIPSSFLADFDVLWNAILVSKTEICQGDGLSDNMVTNSLGYNFACECRGIAGREVATK